MSDFLNSLARQISFDSFADLIAQVGWNLGEVALVILVSWIALRFFVGQIGKGLNRLKFLDQTVQGAITLLLRWAISLLAAYYVMLALGVEATAILAVITGSALAIGLAMQGTLANVASGLMLLILRPISVGDYIRGGGHEGTVVALGIFYTTVDTLEKYRVSIPNRTLFGSAIINMSANPIMTGRLRISVSYDADLDQVSRILVDTAKGTEGVLTTPEPLVLVQDLAESAVSLEVRFDAKCSDLWPTVRALRQASKVALEAEGIEIPFPQTTVHYRPVLEAKSD